MGVYLAKPATEKISAAASSSTLEYGASSMQGWRTAQEDAHCCHLDVDCGDISVFGVFDGHGGADISRFCADRFLAIFSELESYKSGNIEQALEETFMKLDKTLLDDEIRQQLLEIRSKSDQAKNNLHDDDKNGNTSSEESDVSGDDPDRLKAEAQMSMAELIASIVKPKKGSPFLYKKPGQRSSASTSKLAENGVHDSNGASSDSPMTSGRKRTWCSSKDGPSSSRDARNVKTTPSENNVSTSVDDNAIAPTNLGSPPSEPEEKRPMIGEQLPDENKAVSTASAPANGTNHSDNGCHGNTVDHSDTKCTLSDGPLADCKQILNNASGGSDQVKSKAKIQDNSDHNADDQASAEGSLQNGKAENISQSKEEISKRPKSENEADVSGASEKDGSDAAADESEDDEVEGEGDEEEEEEEEEEDDDGDDTSESEDEDDSDESDEIYREMMEDELQNEDSSDSDDDEDLSEKKERLKKMKAFGLLGGAALRRSIMARSGFKLKLGDGEEGDEDGDSEENEEDEDENGGFGSVGPLKVRGGPDIEFLSPPDERVPGVGSGATAIVAVVKNNVLHVANAGDSRCIVYQNGKTIPMSFDHKPDDQIELERIVRAGGRVTPDGRVMGGLNLSRAIGDHLYKRFSDLPLEDQMVSAKPDLKSLPLDGAEFMVLACDGIWNSMTNDEVGEFVHERIDKMSLTEICSEMFDHCLAPSTAGDGTGCDNMTAIIVKFTRKNDSSNGVKIEGTAAVSSSNSLAAKVEAPTSSKNEPTSS